MSCCRALVLCLLSAVVGSGGFAHARGGAKAKAKPPAFPSHVVLVILGGGVRASDMADVELMPTLAAMADSGRRVDKIASGATESYGAAARILTGNAAVVAGSTTARPAHPTVCEYVREAQDLPQEQVWYVSYEGEDQLHLAHSTHAQYGAAYRPGEAFGMGPFAQPLESFLEVLGRPVPMEPETWEQLRHLRKLSRHAMSVWLPKTVDAGSPKAERTERALLRELDRKALLNRGPNPRDELAFRAALTVLEIHRPVLTVVRLGEAEQAQGSYDIYRTVLAANDRGIARLRKAVAADAKMAGRTTFVVVADRGRDEKPGPKGRLGAADASKQRGMVAAIIEGPGLRRRRGKTPARSIDDITPSVGHLLGIKTEHATGRPWLDLLNER